MNVITHAPGFPDVSIGITGCLFPGELEAVEGRTGHPLLDWSERTPLRWEEFEFPCSRRGRTGSACRCHTGLGATPSTNARHALMAERSGPSTPPSLKAISLQEQVGFGAVATTFTATSPKRNSHATEVAG